METQTALTHGSCRLWCGAVDSSVQWKVMGHPAISAINPPGRPIDTVQTETRVPLYPGRNALQTPCWARLESLVGMPRT